MTRPTAMVAALLVCIVAVWAYSEWRYTQDTQPPQNAKTLSAFLDARSQQGTIRRFVHNDKIYIVVVGNPALGHLVFPSGPPAYIFDERGALVDWCYDLGDNTAFVRKWGDFRDSSIISKEAARQLVITHGR